MPGLTGVAAREPGALLERMEAALYQAPRQEVDRAVGEGFTCLTRGAPGSGCVRERAGVRLAVEGHVLGLDARGAALADTLLDAFLARGERFLDGRDGSFQVAVHWRGVTSLFTDPTASRRLFFRHGPWGLAFSPEVAPLRALGGCEVDAANLVQFLASGRFFAGHTLLKGVEQLLPGECLVYREGLVERRRPSWDVAEADVDPFDAEAAMARLEAALERAILRRWARAESPALLLTGGWDSRFIFHTVARHVEDTTRLCTVTWGQDLKRGGSDARVAAEIARRFGTRHLELQRRVERVPATFEAMFQAQSGMTELAFGHADELELCHTLAERHGVRSLFRGDESFGPTGWRASTERELLSKLALPFAEDVAGHDRWLQGGGRDAWEARDALVRRRVAEAPGTMEGLRDTLYFRERLPAFLHHLNYFKAHALEVFNPLLDREVLGVARSLPAEERTDKRLFKACYRRQFTGYLDIPFAERSNGVDWARALRRSTRVAAFVRAGLESLPAPLERGCFLEALDAVVRGDAAPPDARPYRVPPEQLVMRAFVLGQWLREGPSAAASRAKSSRARAAPASEVSAKQV